tara:strand:+ start:335 stop:1387 length:1053 start_codon:yes stop_codon:yes gene_type:complete
VVWNLTEDCNLSCRHCYAADSSKTQKEAISTLIAKKFIDDISGMKIPALLFSGGEPLLRDDIFHLGEYASKKGIYTALSTNGTLITKEAARAIKDAGFSYVGISLDGLKESHDNFRLSAGSFDQSMKGLANCIKQGIKTGVRFTLSKYNYKDLNELILFLSTQKVNRFCLYHLVYSKTGNAIAEHDIDTDLKRETMDAFLSRVEEIANKGINMEILTVDNHADGIYLYNRLKDKNSELTSCAQKLLSSGSGCSAARGIVSVDWNGDVHPCQFWRHVSLGNIKDRPFSQIWDDSSNEFLNTLRNGRENLKGRCGRCKYKKGCGGCRLRAEVKFSDVWAEDPACYLTESEIS